MQNKTVFLCIMLASHTRSSSCASSLYNCTTVQLYRNLHHFIKVAVPRLLTVFQLLNTL